jgi:hypothetical protein
MLKPSLIFIAFLMVVILPVHQLQAQQQQTREKFLFSFNFGGRYINRDSLANTEDLDFMNYLYRQENSAEYGLLSLNFRMAPTEKFEVSATAVLLSDLRPRQLNLDIRYNMSEKDKLPGWGLIGSFFIYPQYLENYNSYHILRDTGFTADLNPNFRQISIFDLGIAIGPSINYHYRRFHTEISFRTGISGFVSFDETISQKKTEANLRREYLYETRFSPAVFFMPEAEVGFDIISSGRTNFGIMLRAGGMWSKRAINYTRTTYTWTSDNSISNDIKPDNEWYRRTEIQGGFYIAF